MNGSMHERISRRALDICRAAGISFPVEFESEMVSSSNDLDIFYGSTPDNPPRKIRCEDWTSYIQIPQGDGTFFNAHQRLNPLQLRESYPLLLNFWLESAQRDLAGGDFIHAAKIFGCLSHLVGDTAQAAHLMDERILTDLFPQENACYVIHKTVENIRVELPNVSYSPRNLGLFPDEWKWRTCEELCCLQQREKVELPVLLYAIENRDEENLKASAARSAEHAAELLADFLWTVMRQEKNVEPEPDICGLVPCEQFCDSYFNYRIMLDRIPGKDIYSPLPLDLGTGGPLHGIAMLPRLTPFIEDVREAFAEYTLPPGVFARFSALVGLQRNAGNKGNARFRILLDGETVWESPEISEESPPLPVCVQLKKASRLKLSVIDPRPDARQTLFFYPVWANLKLRRS